MMPRSASSTKPGSTFSRYGRATVILHAARPSNNRYPHVPTASGLTALRHKLMRAAFVGLRLSVAVAEAEGLLS